MFLLVLFQALKVFGFLIGEKVLGDVEREVVVLKRGGGYARMDEEPVGVRVNGERLTMGPE